MFKKDPSYRNGKQRGTFTFYMNRNNFFITCKFFFRKTKITFFKCKDKTYGNFELIFMFPFYKEGTPQIIKLLLAYIILYVI